MNKISKIEDCYFQHNQNKIDDYKNELYAIDDLNEKEINSLNNKIDSVILMDEYEYKKFVN